jgi:hypothetical protein
VSDWCAEHHLEPLGEDFEKHELGSSGEDFLNSANNSERLSLPVDVHVTHTSECLPLFPEVSVLFDRQFVPGQK